MGLQPLKMPRMLWTLKEILAMNTRMINTHLVTTGISISLKTMKECLKSEMICLNTTLTIWQRMIIGTRIPKKILKAFP